MRRFLSRLNTFFWMMVLAVALGLALLWWQGRNEPVRVLASFYHVRVLVAGDGQRVRLVGEYLKDYNEYHFVLQKYPWAKVLRGPAVRREEGASGRPLVWGEENRYAFLGDAEPTTWSVSYMGFHTRGWNAESDFDEPSFSLYTAWADLVLVDVPYWMWRTAGGVLIFIFGFQLWRKWQRLPPPGKCPGCGYDLRASTRRCPECGRIFDRTVWMTRMERSMGPLLRWHFHVRQHALAYVVTVFLLTMAVMQWLAR